MSSRLPLGDNARLSGGSAVAMRNFVIVVDGVSACHGRKIASMPAAPSTNMTARPIGPRHQVRAGVGTETEVAMPAEENSPCPLAAFVSSTRASPISRSRILTSRSRQRSRSARTPGGVDEGRAAS